MFSVLLIAVSSVFSILKSKRVELLIAVFLRYIVKSRTPEETYMLCVLLIALLPA